MNHKKLPMSGQQSLTVLKKDMPASRYDGRLTWPRHSFHRRDRRCPGSLSSCQDRLAPATSKIHWLKKQKLILKLSESVIYQAVESLIFFFWVSKGDEATHIRDINEEQWGKRVNLHQLVAEAATSRPFWHRKRHQEPKLYPWTYFSRNQKSHPTKNAKKNKLSPLK